MTCLAKSQRLRQLAQFSLLARRRSNLRQAGQVGSPLALTEGAGTLCRHCLTPFAGSSNATPNCRAALPPIMARDDLFRNIGLCQ